MSIALLLVRKTRPSAQTSSLREVECASAFLTFLVGQDLARPLANLRDPNGSGLVELILGAVVGVLFRQVLLLL